MLCAREMGGLYTWGPRGPTMGTRVPSQAKELDSATIRQALHETGDAARGAFERLYWCYEPAVRYSAARAAHLMGYAHELAEVRQQIWVRLLESDRQLLRYYDPERGPFGRFIRLLSFQQALHAIRRDQRHMVAREAERVAADEVEDPGSSEFVAQMIQSEIYERVLEQAAASLSELDLALLREVHFEQRPLSEFAADHGMTLNQLYHRNMRLKQKLRRWCEALLQEPEAKKADVPTPPLALLVALVMAGLAPDHEGFDPGASAGPVEVVEVVEVVEEGESRW